MKSSNGSKLVITTARLLETFSSRLADLPIERFTTRQIQHWGESPQSTIKHCTALLSIKAMLVTHSRWPLLRIRTIAYMYNHFLPASTDAQCPQTEAYQQRGTIGSSRRFVPMKAHMFRYLTPSTRTFNHRTLSHFGYETKTVSTATGSWHTESEGCTEAGRSQRIVLSANHTTETTNQQWNLKE